MISYTSRLTEYVRGGTKMGFMIFDLEQLLLSFGELTHTLTPPFPLPWPTFFREDIINTS